MPTKIRWLVVMLVAVAVMLVVAPNGRATTCIIVGSGRGTLGDGGLWNAGPVQDYVGDNLLLRVIPSSGLDVEICSAFGLFTSDEGIRRESGCSDRYGKGGIETLPIHIRPSDFPNFNWLLNARLLLEVWRFSGSGSYALELLRC